MFLDVWIKLLKWGTNAGSCSCWYGKYSNIVINMLKTCGKVNGYEWNVFINNTRSDNLIYIELSPTHDRIFTIQWPGISKTAGWTNQRSRQIRQCWNIKVLFNLSTMSGQNCNNSIWNIPIKIEFLPRKICFSNYNLCVCQLCLTDLHIIVYKQKHVYWYVILWIYSGKTYHSTHQLITPSTIIHKLE